MMGHLELAEGARKIVEVCAGVVPGERVLIITDTGIPPSVAESLAAAAKAIARDVKVMVMPPLEMPGEEPSHVIAGAMGGADVIFTPTTQTLGHSAALAAALKRGARCIVLTACTEETLTSGGIEADFPALKPLVDLVAERFNGAGRVHVTSPGGTDLRLDVTGRKAASCSGICRTPGQMIGIPDLEVYIAPIEDRTEGRIVIDAAMTGIGLMEHPVTIEVEKGRVRSIYGGKEAERLRALLDKANDSACQVIAELAIGLNPRGRVRGVIIEDEGVYGTGHFALGNNSGFGGMNQAPIHFDMVYLAPTITFGDKVFMRRGRLCDLPVEFQALLNGPLPVDR
jgi:leucyl aminopeptidase (aminopeptidase T)